VLNTTVYYGLNNCIGLRCAPSSGIWALSGYSNNSFGGRCLEITNSLNNTEDNAGKFGNFIADTRAVLRGLGLGVFLM
jgi:hypothetical protein